MPRFKSWVEYSDKRTMRSTKVLGLLTFLSLTACSDVNPQVSVLRGTLTTSNPSDVVPKNGSYIKTDQTATGIMTDTNGATMQISVSKGDTLPADSSSGAYKLELNESIQ